MLTYFIKHITVTGPYLNKKQGRKFVTLYNSKTKKKTQKTYAKYLLEVSLNRELSEDETVDHIDRDKSNDVLSNLRIVSRSQHSKEDSRHSDLITVICPICNSVFERSPRYLKSKLKQGNKVFCSKTCRSQYGTYIQAGGKPIKQNITIATNYSYPKKQ